MADERNQVASFTPPEGVTVLHELGNGLLFVRADVTAVREQDINAQYMKPEMFKQLVENVKKRGSLESIPFLALTDKVEIVSGHHRYRAAREAGLQTIDALLDVSGLTRSQIASKQLAHNAISGESDIDTVKEIAKLISDVDDLLESYIANDVLQNEIDKAEKLIANLAPKVDFDWKTVSFLFLPHQVGDLSLLVEQVKGSQDFIGVAALEQFEDFAEALRRYSKFQDVKAIGAGIHAMIQAANAQMSAAGYEDNAEYVPASRVLGGAVVPADTAMLVKDAIKAETKKSGLDPWSVLRQWAEKSLGNGG